VFIQGPTRFFNRIDLPLYELTIKEKLAKKLEVAITMAGTGLGI